MDERILHPGTFSLLEEKLTDLLNGYGEGKNP